MCLGWDNIGCFIYQSDIAAGTCCIGFAVCSLRCINKVGSSFCGKVFAQIVWQEFPFSLCDRAVCLTTQKKVIAESCPAVLSVELVNLFPVGRSGRSIFKVGTLGSYVGENHLACPGCTVVIEEIVTVYAVLRLCILVDASQNSQFLCTGETEALLSYPSAFMCIFGNEVAHRVDANLIIGESENKTEYKATLVKTEHTPVDGNIRSHSFILDA